MPAAGKRALLATGVVVVGVGVVAGVVASGFGRVAAAVVPAVAAAVVGCLARHRAAAAKVAATDVTGAALSATDATSGAAAAAEATSTDATDATGTAAAAAAKVAATEAAAAAATAEVNTPPSPPPAPTAHPTSTPPPVPPAPLDLHIGRHRIATRYLSASPDAVLGGDLFDIVDSPYGLRVIVGDARGHGAVAVRLAAATVAAFRALAPGTPRLPDLAGRVDAAIGSRLGAEDFVTVVLAEFAPGEVRLVNCGHPAPLRLGARLEALEPAEPVPPLGLHPVPRQQRYRLADGERLLLYTDGLSEARDAEGVMFPLDARVKKALGGPLLHDCLDALHTLVAAHTAGPLTDDLALLICEPRTAPVDVPCPLPETGCDQVSGGGS
ncbi:PP2C family protein-serine/threonine phosphatase [Streptomyces sp. NPDC059009]|uniref:PP2C family protein-serine/threonine phosphatase n=1 Tax=Streptomyces sp. NPDC059009 TaxID=3346694 RepID=UPI0036A152E9